MSTYLFLFTNTVGDLRGCRIDCHEYDPCDAGVIEQNIRPVLEQDGIEWNGEQFFCVELAEHFTRPPVTDKWGDEVLIIFSEEL